MDLNTALEQDNVDGGTVLLHLDAISQLLSAFRTRCPQTFTYLCEDGRRTCEMSLGDAISAVNEALDVLEDS